MTSRMRTSRAGIDLIKAFEGFREHAVRLPDGRWTVGHGHVRTAHDGLRVSEKEAEELLKADLLPIEETIRSYVFATLTQNQFDALASFVFNISPAEFIRSDTLQRLNMGDVIGAAAGFDIWRQARLHGRIAVVDALVRRRAAEKALFLSSPDGWPNAPTPLVSPEPAGSPDVDAAAAASGQPALRADLAVGSDLSGGERVKLADDVPMSEADRLARILSRVERTAPSSPPKVRQPAPAERPASLTASGQRRIIDDTEQFDPGKDPSQLFSEALDAEKHVNGRVKRLGVLSNGALRIAPFVVLLALALLGLAIGLVELQRAGAGGSPAMATAVFVSGIVAAMSAYLIATRYSGGEI
jgi:GH24 family phage-related lysozyme (muramidase)